MDRNSNNDHPTLCVMSYNVNFALYYEQEEPTDAARHVASVIKNSGADVVALQETNEKWEHLMKVDLGSTYPYQYFEHSDKWCAGGGGFLSKFPFAKTNWFAPLSDWFHGSKFHAFSSFHTLLFYLTRYARRD